MRRIVRLLLTCTLLVSFVSVVVSPHEAQAATGCPLAAPAIKVGYGENSITVAWSKVSGAASYTVAYGTSSTLSGSKKISSTGSSKLVKGLANGRRYYARVTAVAADSRCNANSAIRSGVPDAGYPRLLSLTVAPVAKNQVRVSWTGQGRGTKVAVIAGSNASAIKLPFQSAWHPITTTAITLTVPAALVAQLGTGSGNPIFVKVATYNSLSAGTSMPRVKSITNAYRLSLAGPNVYAKATTTTKALKVATWNVHSVASSTGIIGQTWADRRKKVAAGIRYSGADVIATVELTTAPAGNGKSQWQDLRDLLAEPTYGGYRIANNSVGPAGVNATKGAHIFYKPSAVTLLGSGIVSAAAVTGNWPAEQPDRYFSWAKFRVNATGKHFYAASVHLPAGGAWASLRVREAQKVAAYLGDMAGSLPIVLMGDLNSSFAAEPNGPQTVLVKAGYYDASSALQRGNPRFPTCNITNQIDNLADRGYPYTPYKYTYPAPRIDFIMIKNSPGALKYANQLVMKDGRFDPAYHGSDHNLQWADIGIG